MGKHKSRPFQCGACHRRFATLDGTRDHVRQNHAKRGADIYERIESIRPPEDDSSLAEDLIDLQMRAACGEDLSEGERVLLESFEA